jgi:hypothetical protein
VSISGADAHSASSRATLPTLASERSQRVRPFLLGHGRGGAGAAARLRREDALCSAVFANVALRARAFGASVTFVTVAVRLPAPLPALRAPFELMLRWQVHQIDDLRRAARPFPLRASSALWSRPL